MSSESMWGFVNLLVIGPGTARMTTMSSELSREDEEDEI